MLVEPSRHNNATADPKRIEGSDHRSTEFSATATWLSAVEDLLLDFLLEMEVS